MKAIEIDSDVRSALVENLAQVPLFKSLKENNLEALLKYAQLLDFQAGETIMKKGSQSDSFAVILAGSVDVFAENENGNRTRLTSLGVGSTVGEIGVILGEPASATALTKEAVRALIFPQKLFFNMFEKIPNFGTAVVRAMAQRLEEVAGQIALPRFKAEPGPGRDRRVTDLLPVSFLQRHRVLPVRKEKNQLTVGFVGEPTSAVMDALYKQLPGLEIVPVHIEQSYFDAILRTRVDGKTERRAGRRDSNDSAKAVLDDKLTHLLERMVAEGASDLHLSETDKPYWRVDGDLVLIDGAVPFDKGEIRRMFDPAMAPRHRQELGEMHDTDFGYGLEGTARFRVNLFHDAKGTSASIRQIPSNILSLEDYQEAETLRRLCHMPNGLILVTGPTGSGKSTTIAAMIEYINQQFAKHIITLEDPVEFTFDNDKSVVKQREIGAHTPNFERGLRASMREDPDVILCGEIIDLKTLDLTLDAAATGHLVFSTLHTNSAGATIDRVIDMFPPSQQDNIRNKVADILKGIVCQTLCKRIGGGRVLAVELLVVTRPVANLIREAKTVQIPTVMQATKKDGHIQLNESLALLVRNGQVAVEEAMLKAVDKNDLTNRIRRPQQP